MMRMGGIYISSIIDWTRIYLAITVGSTRVPHVANIIGMMVGVYAASTIDSTRVIFFVNIIGMMIGIYLACVTGRYTGL
jgi:hypothetical protein